jgi:hypothetical protein
MQKTNFSGVQRLVQCLVQCLLKALAEQWQAKADIIATHVSNYAAMDEGGYGFGEQKRFVVLVGM